MYHRTLLFLWAVACLNSSLVAGSAGKKHALLVGCTVYPHSKTVSELWGPVNDVKLWTRVLEHYDFPKHGIRTLVGWSEDSKTRPTRANIVAAWEDLIAKSDGETQIFILMGGHGAQIPIPDSQTNPLDPKNPEPDGLDEIFLAADLKTVDGKLAQYIRDDEFGAWLERFRAKGASVWVVFDCCHSGTMERGTGGIEVTREVRAQQIGISDEAIRAAQLRARKAVDAAKKKGLGAIEPSMLGVDSTFRRKGSVVVTYACQSFEQAPELPRPKDAARAKENYYGLLSYTLVKTLDQRGSALSYRQLSQLLIGQYAAQNFNRTPFSEGDLDREVFGLRTWPRGSDIHMQRDRTKLRLDAGELRGLTLGSVLSVHPRAGSRRDPKEVLGYVRITSLTPISAEATPCASPDGKKAQAKVEEFEELSRCQLLVRNFGDMRLRVAVRAANAKDADKVAFVKTTLARMPKEMQALLELVSDEAKAQYLLWIEDGLVYLQAGSGRQVDTRELSAERARTREYSLPPRRYGGYSTDDPDELALRLERDLQAVYTWQNLWRVGGTLGSNAGEQGDVGLRLEFEKLNPEGTSDGELLNGHPVAAGQRVRWRLRNEGFHNLWVTRIVLDGGFGIHTKALQLSAGRSTPWFPGTIQGDTPGKEGFLVMAVPMDVLREQPDFQFLDQPSLKSKKSAGFGERLRAAGERSTSTPFQQLMKAATFGQGTRSFQEDEPTNPAILMWSWIALPDSSRHPDPEK